MRGGREQGRTKERSEGWYFEAGILADCPYVDTDCISRATVCLQISLYMCSSSFPLPLSQHSVPCT